MTQSEDLGAAADGRRGQIAANLHVVHERIAAACRHSGRQAGQVSLVVVTKTFPASDVEILAELGCTDVAENRDQEAVSKVAAVKPGTALRWHMIGQLQRNKVKSVVTWASVVESIDRIELAHALSRAAVAHDLVVDVHLQVNLDPIPTFGRGGVAPDQAQALALECLALPGLRLVGVMGVAPHPGDPVRAFTQLAQVRERLQRVDPHCWQMSAGMSQDLEEAIDAGATHVRIGGAVLGNRPTLK